MTREDIEQWTRKAGGFDATPEFLVKSAALVASAERERIKQAHAEFEAWHKSTHIQTLVRYGHTYKNMHVRNRWQGWLAAHGIKGET